MHRGAGRSGGAPARVIGASAAWQLPQAPANSAAPRRSPCLHGRHAGAHAASASATRDRSPSPAHPPPAPGPARSVTARHRPGRRAVLRVVAGAQIRGQPGRIHCTGAGEPACSGGAYHPSACAAGKALVALLRARAHCAACGRRRNARPPRPDRRRDSSRVMRRIRLPRTRLQEQQVPAGQQHPLIQREGQAIAPASAAAPASASSGKRRAPRYRHRSPG